MKLSRRRTVSTTVALAVGCCAAAACSTTYQPRADGQIGLVIHHGAAMYVKNGQEFPVGPLGGALEALVTSAAPAAAAAHRARNQLAVGIPLYVGGVAALVLRLALFRGSAGWIALGAGATSAVTGLSLMGAGFTNAVDAVNIYNDSLSSLSSPPLP